MSVLLLAMIAAPLAYASDLDEAFRDASRRVSATQASLSNRFTWDADSDEEPKEPLDNFSRFSDGLYRSAQPSAAGYAELRRRGVRAVLILKETTGMAGTRAAAAGLAVRHVPMSGFAQPRFEQIDAALALMRDPALRPLLVHCQFGKDRTGFSVAAYRVIYDGLSDAEAAAEARANRCCFVAFGDLERFLARYRRHRQAVAARSLSVR